MSCSDSAADLWLQVVPQQTSTSHIYLECKHVFVSILEQTFNIEQWNVT